MRGRARAQADVSADAVPSAADATVRVDFTYSVVWTPTDTPYARRMEKYRRVKFLPQHLEARAPARVGQTLYPRRRRALTRGRRAPQIHWFSIINSCVTVLLLTGFLATILLRVLRNDFLRFSRDDEGAR